MINRILMELYDDYEKGNIESLVKFANITFPQNGTEKLFIGCALILFSRASGYKPRYDVTRENLYSIVLASKEKVGSSNLLAFYMDRLNTTKGISKYLNSVLNDKKLDDYANVILAYLEQFKPSFISDLKQNYKKIEEFTNSKPEDVAKKDKDI